MTTDGSMCAGRRQDLASAARRSPHPFGGSVLTAARARLGMDDARDAGNAVVEFLGASLILLVPVVYLVVVLAQVQAATFAVDAAAREASRAVVTAPSAQAEGRARAAMDLALSDQGFDRGLAAAALSVRCSAVGCTESGSTVTVEVTLDVALPGIPAMLGDHIPLRIPVTAAVTAPVDSFRATGAS